MKRSPWSTRVIWCSQQQTGATGGRHTRGGCRHGKGGGRWRRSVCGRWQAQVPVLRFCSALRRCCILTCNQRVTSSLTWLQGAGTCCVCCPSAHLRLLALWPHQQLQFYSSVQAPKAASQDAHARLVCAAGGCCCSWRCPCAQQRQNACQSETVFSGAELAIALTCCCCCTGHGTPVPLGCRPQECCFAAASGVLCRDGPACGQDVPTRAPCHVALGEHGFVGAWGSRSTDGCVVGRVFPEPYA